MTSIALIILINQWLHRYFYILNLLMLLMYNSVNTIKIIINTKGGARNKPS